MFKKWIVTLFTLAAANFAAAGDFAVSPMLINVELNPGESQSFEISINGEENGKVNISLFGLNQEITGHMNFMEVSSGDSHFTALSWVSFPQTSYQIRRGDNTLIKGEVRVPRDAKGTYLAAVMVEEDLDGARSNVMLKVRYAVILNINVAGNPGKSITRFDDVQLVETEAGTQVEATFTNQSDFMGFLDSTIQIRSPDRRLVARAPLKTESAWQRQDEQSRVYPGATVKVVARLPEHIDSGTYLAIVRNQFNGKMMPVYRADLAYVSTVSPDAESASERQVVVNPDRLLIRPLASGLSITPLSLINNTGAEVSLTLPAGDESEGAVQHFEFIPAEVTLAPGMKRRVVLKQSHRPGIAYIPREYKVMSVGANGEQHPFVIATFAAESES